MTRCVLLLKESKFWHVLYKTIYLDIEEKHLIFKANIARIKQVSLLITVTKPS